MKIKFDMRWTVEAFVTAMSLLLLFIGVVIGEAQVQLRDGYPILNAINPFVGNNKVPHSWVVVVGMCFGGVLCFFSTMVAYRLAKRDSDERVARLLVEVKLLMEMLEFTANGGGLQPQHLPPRPGI